MITKLDRWRGSLVGALTGDAGGAPYETKRADFIKDDFKRRGGLTFFDYIDPFYGKREVKKGQPTDDAELTAATAQSMVQPIFRESDLYLRLRGFIHGNGGEPRKSILTDGDAYGSGGTLRSALRADSYEESFAWFRKGVVRVLPTNGSLMRNTATALRGDVTPILVDHAIRQSCVTHIHPAAQVACITHALLLHYVLTGLHSSCWVAWGKTLERISELIELERKSKDKTLLEDLLKVRALGISKPREDEIWPHTGDVTLSLRVALWAFLTSTDFRDGLTKAISIGGDVDTYGAIAGALLGAQYGIEGIPSEWRVVLIGREIMEDLARDLYKFSGS